MADHDPELAEEAPLRSRLWWRSGRLAAPLFLITTSIAGLTNPDRWTLSKAGLSASARDLLGLSDELRSRYSTPPTMMYRNRWLYSTFRVTHRGSGARAAPPRSILVIGIFGMVWVLD